jgi:O-antigen ligase
MKSKLIIILLIMQALTAVLMSVGAIGRGAAFFVSVAMALFMCARPLKEGMALFIISIPFFFALPFSASFDSMSSWRILVVIIFLRFLYEYDSVTGFAESNNEARIANNGISINRIPWIEKVMLLAREWLRSPLFWSVAAFIGWCVLSSIFAPHPIAGLKKAAFLANIFLLYPVTQFLIRRGAGNKIIQACLCSLVMTLIAGYGQLASLFFTGLENFWRFWAGSVIPVFYGWHLGELLQTSNTWFSSGGNGAPLLRMFSVFPDSHSFALFIVFGLILVVSEFLNENNAKINFWRTVRYAALAAACYMAIIFSGSRGVWFSALAGAVTAAAVIVYAKKRPLIQLPDGIAKKILISFVVFGLLFFPASLISSLTQRAGGEQGDALSSIKRIKSIADFGEVSNRSRLGIWKTAILTAAHYPVLGVGFGNFSVALGEDISAAKQGASAHNLYLDIASETGFPGLAAFFAMAAIILVRSAKKAHLTAKQAAGSKVIDVPAIMLVFPVYAVWILGYNLFDVVLMNDKVLIFATIIIAMALEATYGRKSLQFAALPQR